MQKQNCFIKFKIIAFFAGEEIMSAEKMISKAECFIIQFNEHKSD